MEPQKVRLPYVNNAKAFLITIAINLGIVFLFNWPEGISYSGVALDSLLCVIITTVIDMWIVFTALKKLRASGEMPYQAPLSPFMQRLPQNPLALSALYIVGFGAATAGANALILWTFGLQSLTFWPWLVYKIIYATVLTVKITEYCIFRYVQPDWANAGSAEMRKAVPLKPIKNPLPKVSLFKEIYGSVTGNIGLNIILGSLLGGVTVAPGGTVVLHPTTLQGIPITGLAFGLIFGVLATRGILKEVNAVILASGPAITQPAFPDKRFTWMPMGKTALTALICAFMMLFSAVALWAVMKLFGIFILNFYQFIIFITTYATLVGKPLAYLLVRRCMQPDYVRHALRKTNSAQPQRA